MTKKVIYPVDVASFKRMREDGFVYVDKTQYIHFLVENKGKYFFLARPRRFGKSLFLDTLAEYFKGNRFLFKGLAIDKLQPEEWKSYPVLKFNLSGNNYLNENSLSQNLNSQLAHFEKIFNVSYPVVDLSPAIRLNQLIIEIKNQTKKKIVILIDEYDAPLSSSFDHPKLQAYYQEQLHGFYSVLKKAEDHLHFCMLTGVTRYGKVSVFSGLNNLKDITFLNDYSAVCGITRQELEINYKEGIERLASNENITFDEVLNLLKFHYDGYHFSDSMVDIYNPFSINHAMDNSKLSNYWCRSGLPTLLAKSLKVNDYDIEKLSGEKVEESELIDLSIPNMQPIPLFYQTGYLTLKSYDKRRQLFTLGYPNREVEEGILKNILKFYSERDRSDKVFIYDLEEALEEGNPGLFVKLLSEFLSGIPLDLREWAGKYENYYHTIIYCIIKLIGLDIQAEYATSEGYIDILIKTKDYIYIIELKVNGNAQDAMSQIEERHYYAPFATESRKLYKIGLGFSKETGSINSYLIQQKN